MPKSPDIAPNPFSELGQNSWSVDYFATPEGQMDARTLRTPNVIQVYLIVAVAIIIADIFFHYFVPREQIEWAILFSSAGAIAIVVFGLIIFNRVTKQTQYLKEMLNIDRTTGLYSSVFLMEELDRIVNNNPKNLALLFLDLDELKKYNDAYGHRAGDKLIHDAAESLAEGIMGHGVGFRYGGDEFVAILDGVPVDLAMIVAKRVHKLFEQKHISASIGLYQWRSGMSVDELLHAADKAMYRAKLAGKGRIYFGDIDTGDIDNAAMDQ